MGFLEKIAMWGGIAAIIIAIFAIIILYLTRKNIIDLLDRDVIMYDKNYQLKKEALESAFNCLDTLAQQGAGVKQSPQFIAEAKEAYNALLCTVYSPKLYQEFYKYALDATVDSFSVEELEKFKITCRVELFYKKKKSGEGFKGNVADGGLTASRPQARPLPPQQPIQPRPAQPRPTQPRPQRPQQD